MFGRHSCVARGDTDHLIHPQGIKPVPRHALFHLVRYSSLVLSSWLDSQPLSMRLLQLPLPTVGRMVLRLPSLLAFDPGHIVDKVDTLGALMGLPRREVVQMVGGWAGGACCKQGALFACALGLYCCGSACLGRSQMDDELGKPRLGQALGTQL